MNASRPIFVLLLAVICGCSKPGPPLTTKSYPIGSPYQLKLSFPATWKDEVARFVEYQTNSTSTYDGIRFTPTNGERCFFQIILIPILGTNTPPPDLKSNLLKGSPNDLSNAVETVLDIRDLKGAQASGYYFRVTDRHFVTVAPTPPDYKYLTQGLVHLGPLVLSFRLFDDDAATEAEALKVIRTAQITKE